MRRLAVSVALAAGLAGCVPRPPAPAPNPHYVVGGGYQMEGVWYYPRESFQGDETGLATVLPNKRGLTADGEAYDPAAMVAAHQTLQLPAIVRVTNLGNGLQALVRVNDRGPASPGRIIGLSRRAASVLGIAPGEAVPVRVQVEERMSLRLREQLGGAPAVQVSAAPRASVVAETLPPPPGVAQSRRGQTVAGPGTASDSGAGDMAERVPDQLPAEAQRVAVTPGRLMLRAGSFGRAEYARQRAALLAGLGARVVRRPEGRTERFDVVAGPFGSVSDADAALDQAMRDGVSDARITVE